MTMSITMIQSRMGEAGSVLVAGSTYSVSDAFGAAMVGAKYATDTNGALTPAPTTPSPAQATAGISLVSGDRNTVVVYGATPAGIAAAVGAARQNKRVILLSDSARLGGVMGYGITHQDVETNTTPATVTGFAKELLSLIGRQETNSAKTWQRFHRLSCDGKPSWFIRAVNELVAAERNISVVYGCEMVSASKSGAVISSLTVRSGGALLSYTGGVFIDASYTGDLAAAAGCTVSIGREANATYTETLNGILATSPFAGGAVSPYVIAGDSGSGLLPFIDSTAGTTGAADGRVQLFCYRLFVTTSAPDRVAFPAPDAAVYAANVAAGYYEILGRAMAATPTSFDTMAEVFSMYTNGVSSGYYDLNSKVGISTNYPNQAECLEYITAAEARRAVIRENAKQYLLGLFYWIRYSGDARIPGALVTEIATYGLSASELQATGGFSPEWYVREGRRIVGDFVMSETGVTLANGYADKIAFLSYGFDSHMVRFVNVAGVVKTEGSQLTNLTATQLGAAVPYRALLPKVAEVTNLLCPGCPSVSRVVWLTTRLEPALMSMGEAAGVAASLAIDNGSTVQAVDTARLQRILDPYEVWDGIVLSSDGSYAEGTLTQTGTWVATATAFGFIGASALSDGNAGKASRSLKFAPNIQETGSYQLFLRYPPSTANRANNVPVTVTHADGTTTVTVNQLYPGGKGGGWESLGTYTMLAGSPSASFVVVDNTGTLDFVVASALKCVKV